MSSNEVATKRRDARLAVFALPFWTALGSIQVHVVLAGDPSWITGVALAVDVVFLVINSHTLWKAASNA